MSRDKILVFIPDYPNPPEPSYIRRVVADMNNKPLEKIEAYILRGQFVSESFQQDTFQHILLYARRRDLSKDALALAVPHSINIYGEPDAVLFTGQFMSKDAQLQIYEQTKHLVLEQIGTLHYFDMHYT